MVMYSLLVVRNGHSSLQRELSKPRNSSYCLNNKNAPKIAECFDIAEAPIIVSAPIVATSFATGLVVR